MREFARALILAGAAISAPWLAAAQQIRGVVRDDVASAPIAGAVVAILDSSGVGAARTITDGAGRFSIARPARAARVRVLRIGYEPRELVIPAADASGEIDIALRRIPPLLDAVQVTDREQCPERGDRGAAFTLWEQARAGLLASVVTMQANPPSATTLVFHRRLSAADNVVQSQEVTTGTGRTPRPFSAFASAQTFADHGYMVEDRSGRMFFGPDAEVLVDESFIATHCVHLQSADAGHPDQVGLAFTPAGGRDTIVDVTGVVWIDRAAPAIRSLDFRYTGVEPASARAGAGGELRFRTLANGASFVERWRLRLPVLSQLPFGTTPRSGTARGAVRRQDRVDFHVTAIDETGGQVVEAHWSDGALWRDLPSGIGGVVTREQANAGIAGVIVSLAGTQDTATSDAHGQFTLAPVIPGRYTVTVVDTSFSAFGAARRASRTADIAAGEIAEFNQRFPAPPRAVAAMPRPRTRVVMGVVTDTANRPVRDVNVVAREHASAVTNDAGRFQLQLPTADDVVLDVRRVGFMPERYGIPAGGDTSFVIALLPSVQQLAAVEVTDRATFIAPGLRGFEARARERVRGTSSGVFVTPDDIDKRKPVFATQLLYDVPGIRVQLVGKHGTPVIFGFGHTIRGGSLCPAAVYIDGVRVQEGDEDVPVGVAIDRYVTPWDVAGIEVYASANAAPAQFQSLNGGCAVVVIWTKHGG